MRITSKLSLVLLLSLVFPTGPAVAQKTLTGRAAPHKLSPAAARALKVEDNDTSRFFVGVSRARALQDLLAEHGIPPQAIIREIPEAGGVLVRLPHDVVREHLIPSSLVTFIDIRNTSPVLERAVSGLDLSANKVNMVQHHYPELDGSGLVLSIKENAFDSTDIDLRGRYLPNRDRDQRVVAHATNVATMAAGAGNSFYTGKGAAPRAILSSSSFRNLFPDPAEYYLGQGIFVQNHSYGLGIENYYGAEARAYDTQLAEIDSLLHVFSAGNQGEATGEAGPYATVPNYANLTGTMKMAKNVFTVGAVDTLLRVMRRSSRGPAYDGRVKPELVAFGQDGSSGAAAVTSGVLLLMQQAYKERNGDLPPASLIRAVALNSADDVGIPGPDYTAGYGNLDAYGAINTIREERYFVGSVQDGETITFDLALPQNAKDLKVTLAWIDPPAELNAARALRHDLDVTVSPTNSAVQYLPLVLNTFPHEDSLALPAGPGFDRLNNQEQVVITELTATSYQVRVHGYAVGAGSQHFSVAYEWDTPGFNWTFPLRDDPVEQGATRALRWDGPKDGNGNISLRFLNGGGDWQPVAEGQGLSAGHLLWSAPSALGQAQLRMTIGEDNFLSDTFIISRAPDLALLLDCTDELGLGWTRRENEQAYRLFGQEEELMESLLTIEGDFVSLNRQDYAYDFFSLAALFPGNRSGVRSPALNVEFQSAGCYQEQFFAEAEAAAVGLELRLGLLNGISRVVFEKLEGPGFQEISSVSNPAALTLRAKDLSPSLGLNVYRTTVILEDGGARLGQEASVVYVTDEAFVYPNPTTTEEGAGIILKTLPAGETFFHLYSSDGRLLRRFSLLSENEEIPVEGLKRGTYFYRVTSDGASVASGRLVVQ